MCLMHATWITNAASVMQILEDNARALAAGAKLPYVGAAGKVSVPESGQGSTGRQAMPRDHA